MKTLPKEIFVTLEQAGTPDAFLNANKDLRDCGDRDDVKTVGRYVLTETVTLSFIADTQPANFKTPKRKTTRK